MSFTPKDVMTLREKTGLGMMDCKRALEHASGNAVAAEEWLREQRKGKMETRTERVTGEGRIGVAVKGSTAVIVEVRTETDFTARNESFQAMVTDVVGAAMKQPAGSIAADSVIAKRIDDLRITTGENVNFARGVKLEGGRFGYYLHHDGKRAALIQIEGQADDQLLKGICQHIVFYDPLGVSESDVPPAELTKIRTEALAEAKQTGKNDEIAAKIAEGKVRKYLEERTLLHQKFVLDETKRVKDVLPAGVQIKRFVRYTLGS